MSGWQQNGARQAPASRAGFTFAELMGAIVVLGVIVALSMQMLSWSVRHRAAMERRRAALREAENVLERWTARSWDALTPEAAAAAELSEPARRQLPGGRLRVAIEDVSAMFVARRLTVEVSWRDGPAPPPAPVRLSTWVYRDADPSRQGASP